MRTRTFLMGLALVLAGTLAAPAVASADVVLKMATLAPRGSAWANLLEKGSKMIEKDTDGRVKLKWYFGGQQGDEKDVIRKIRLGQLDGGAVTSTGLGGIYGDVRVFQLPMLWDSEKQLDYVRDKLSPELETEFMKKGYVLLAWGDVGWSHLYSKNKFTGLSDLKKSKMWAWDVDPIIKALFDQLGVNTVPLGVPEVKTALGTGLIDAAYGAPLSTVALQWYTSIKYATSRPIAYAIGALVLSEKAWEKVSPEDQKVIRKHMDILGKKLIATVRKDNERAKKALAASGITFVDVPDSAWKQVESDAQKVWKKLAGKVYSQALLDKVLAYKKQAPR